MARSPSPCFLIGREPSMATKCRESQTSAARGRPAGARPDPIDGDAHGSAVVRSRQNVTSVVSLAPRAGIAESGAVNRPHSFPSPMPRQPDATAGPFFAAWCGAVTRCPWPCA